MPSSSINPRLVLLRLSIRFLFPLSTFPLDPFPILLRCSSCRPTLKRLEWLLAKPPKRAIILLRLQRIGRQICSLRTPFAKSPHNSLYCAVREFWGIGIGAFVPGCYSGMVVVLLQSQKLSFGDEDLSHTS